MESFVWKIAQKATRICVAFALTQRVLKVTQNCVTFLGGERYTILCNCLHQLC